MGHKVHPLGFRLGVIQDWQAKWYADDHYAESLREDLKLRQAIQDRYAEAAISLVLIARQAKEVTVTIHTARPGIVIGRGGQRVDELRLHLENLIGRKIRLNIQEIRQPELDATLVAKTIAEQIQRRVAYRRAMKQAIFRTIQAGAKGIRISCAGRLGDAEIARRQTMHEGQVPLHTLRADIDYGFTEAHTTMGRIGVKVWIYKGEVLPEREIEAGAMPAELTATTSAEAKLPAAAEPMEKPAKPAPRRRAKAAVSAEPEAPAQPAAAEGAEVAPEAKAAEKPAKPAPRGRAKAAVSAEPEAPAQPAAAKGAEVAPEAKAAEKLAKPAPRGRAKAAVSTEPEAPAQPAAVKGAEVAPETKAAEKPAKPAPRGRAKAAKPEKTATQPATDTKAEASTLVEKGENNATT